MSDTAEVSSNGRAGVRGEEGLQDGWLVLIYRVPSEPSNNRVSVWRELKRLGALYLQQCACLLPAFPACEAGAQQVMKKIESLQGVSNLFRVPQVDPGQEGQLIEGFRRLSAKEYAEIVEECRTKFAKEIEFERFRGNFTYEEAEEIREDLDKIRRWYGRVVERDWFDSGLKDQVAAELEQCERLIEAFEEEVYRRAGEDEQVLGRPSGGPAPAGDAVAGAPAPGAEEA